jgi:hypothetical protein
MDPPMRDAYSKLEDDIRHALNEHNGNRSVLSTMLNTLLLYPDHPYGIGTLYGTEFDSEAKCKVPFVIAKTRDLPEDSLYSKERRLLQEIKQELAEGRRCQVFAVYTRKHDVTARLERILSNEGIRTAVLRANVDTSKREAWYARQINDGVQVVICHPKLVETGLDLLDFPTILFYESGYSLHTLRQASRRSWRIGQRRPVRSPDGKVIGGLDVPISEQPSLRPQRWTAQALVGYDTHQSRNVFGGQVSYARGPFTVSGGVIGATAFVGAGIRF